MKISHTEIADSPIAISGALDFDHRPNGISPRRLPAWTRPQVPQVMDVMVRMPSGVRLSLVTDSSFVELEVLTTRMFTPPDDPRPAAFDLLINHDEIRHQAANAGNLIQLDASDPTKFELIRGEAYSVRFDDLPTGENQLELWLPQGAFVEIRGISIDDGASLRAPADDRPKWLHYGSSISHCMEADRPTGTWPAVAASMAGLNLQSFGFGGQCHLDQFVARTIRDLPADVISIKVGINVINGDTMRERVFPSALHGFLDTVREGQPETPILVISPIFCPSAEDQPGPTLREADGKFRTYPGHDELRVGCMSLKRTRQLIEQVIETRREAGDNNLHYLSGLELFSEADAQDLPDDLHPNPAGYRRMGERFVPHVSLLF